MYVLEVQVILGLSYLIIRSAHHSPLGHPPSTEHGAHRPQRPSSLRASERAKRTSDATRTHAKAAEDRTGRRPNRTDDATLCIVASLFRRFDRSSSSPQRQRAGSWGFYSPRRRFGVDNSTGLSTKTSIGRSTTQVTQDRGSEVRDGEK